MLRGRAEVVVGQGVLLERVLPLERVAQAIADASIDRRSDSDPQVLSALIEQAVELLQEGERTAAAALFEAARAFSPDDPVIRNNYAFCILLDRPAEAKSILNEALDSGVSSPEVTLCNLMLAHHLLGDNAAALEIAANAYTATDGPPTRAYLWDLGADDQWVVGHLSPREWIVRTAMRIEGQLGSPGRWTQLSNDYPQSLDSLTQVLHQEE